jgi:hypothetical protein
VGGFAQAFLAIKREGRKKQRIVFLSLITATSVYNGSAFLFNDKEANT